MPAPIYVVDAFTSRPFAGNPAAVCLLDEPAGAEWMQKVATEMKLAETAFLSPRSGGFDLRWFTPTTEVDLCGHATLASAHVLWESERLAEDDPATFHTKSGVLTCTRHGYGIQMDFPAEPPVASKFPNSLDVDSDVVWTGKNRFDWLLVVEDEAGVCNYQPEMEVIAAMGKRGVILTAESDSADHDFVSRFFAPCAGVPEDPVTGSAHCCLGPYWAEQLGKIDLVGYQCSQRGGTVRVAVRGDRVLLQGHAVTVLRGELLV
ncbi:MAG: PhzF family phenazine biosynthesis protein [Fimbriimonadales bacterium]